jgi:hypothetical protein
MKMAKEMFTNAEVMELMRKAAITTPHMTDAGLLNPEQSDLFIDYVKDESVMMQQARVIRFRGAQKLIEKLNVLGRVAVPKAEAVDPGVRRGIQTSKVTLEHHEIMVPFEIGDIVKEENIEGDDVEDSIARMMARRLANNMEEAFWDGNTVGPARLEGDLLEGGSSTLYVKDAYMALFNGWLANAQSGHVVDAGNDPMGPALISRAIQAMPNKFKKDKSMLKFWLSWDHEQAYRESVSTRATQSGDNALSASGNVPAFGIELFPVSLLDSEPRYVENSVANSDGTTPTALSFAPITNVVITATTLDGQPTAAFIEDTDYTVDYANGTWTRLGAGAIGSGATVKVTYQTAGRMILTPPGNLIIAIGRDLRIERQRNIYRGTVEYAISAKIFCIYEENDAVVVVNNIAVPSA